MTKLYSIQYLRGMAALLVLITHAISHPLDVANQDVVRIGGLGVAMFFVISGCVMVLISGKGSFDRWEFYRRRILRVVPLYWVATFGVAVVAILLPGALKNSEFTMKQLILSLFFVPHYRDNGEIVPLLKLGWTLNLEMFFYACFGLLAFLRATQRVFALSVLFGILAVIGMMTDFTDPLLKTYTMFDMVSFCIGMWVGLAIINGHSVVTSKPLQIAFGIAGVALITVGFLFDRGAEIFPPITAAQALGSAALLILFTGIEARMPRSRVGELFGDASYSIYLVHMYFVGATVFVIHRVAPTTPVLVTMAIGLVAGGVGGLLTHLFVEKPLMAATRRVPRRTGTALPVIVSPSTNAANDGPIFRVANDEKPQPAELTGLP